MHVKLNKYLIELRNKSNLLERTDINGKVNDSLASKQLVRTFCSMAAASLVWHLDEGFNDTFIGYASTVLSIFIGLFITAIIFSFDKFYEPTDLNVATSKVRLWDTQSYNYSKQFAYITGYNIVLCIFTLALLLLNSLFKDKMSIELHKYAFNFNEIDFVSIRLFFQITLVILTRFFVLYWIFKVMYNTLFVVSSMVKFMDIKIDKKNDSN